MIEFKDHINGFINYCRYHKKLSDKTIRAYRIDLIQFQCFTSELSNIVSVDATNIAAILPRIFFLNCIFMFLLRLIKTTRETRGMNQALQGLIASLRLKTHRKSVICVICTAIGKPIMLVY